MKKHLYTSLYLSENLRNKLDLCVEKLGVDQCQLLSVLCYKAGMYVCADFKQFETVEYQERGGDYEITPVCFYSSDHEYMHANRYMFKLSVSKILACAMELFLDEIMEKGINQMELLQLQIIQNSYKKKYYKIQNCTIDLTKNDQLEECKMRMRKKSKKT